MATNYEDDPEPPFAIQIELVEGCNLYCDFCGLQGIREAKDKTFKMMEVVTAQSIAEQIEKTSWNSRIEFAMHGEPTMHEAAAEMVEIFRKKLPKHQLMMTSNGGGLLRPPGVVPNLNMLFDAGLNVFAFDAYEYVKIKDKVDAALGPEYPSLINEIIKFDIHRYPDEREYSPHNRYGHKARKFIRVQDISVAAKGTHSIINNHTGCGSPPLDRATTQRCAKPFREISIRYDGNVAICCNDWRGIYKCGNAVTDGIEQVWRGSAFRSARRYIIRGERIAVFPCAVCDARSYRVGLLPDKKGKEVLPAPTAEDRQTVIAATMGDPYTKPVKREYE